MEKRVYFRSFGHGTNQPKKDPQNCWNHLVETNISRIRNNNTKRYNQRFIKQNSRCLSRKDWFLEESSRENSKIILLWHQKTYSLNLLELIQPFTRKTMIPTRNPMIAHLPVLHERQMPTWHQRKKLPV